MRVVAVCAIVAFVAWASEQALAPPTIADRNIAAPVYAVEQPVASTVAVPTVGASNPPATPTPTAPNAVRSPAAVDVLPERGERLQVTATVPPPAAPVGWNGLPLAPDGLNGCDEARFYREQVGLPARFDGLAWRESNCRADASNWCCSGLWQIHKLWVPALAKCGVFVRGDLYDPQRNACAAAHVYAVQGGEAWSAW